MHAAGLMAKLLEIERRAASGDGSAVRALALAAQDELLQIERDLIATLTDNDELRRRMGRIGKGGPRLRFRGERIA